MKTRKIIDYIVKWLTNYAAEAGMSGFVCGVSGGIDSAVTSTLSAMTGLNVMVLNMPIHQAESQQTRAAKHIAWLEGQYENVCSETIDLTPVLKAFEQVFPKPIQDDLAMANTRSRIRMITLYAYANHHRLLVVGTGNKVEDFGVGFYTKYGDGGVDVAPIADLMKSEVYAIGRELGILNAIIEAPPTDGLFHDNRSDEDQLGATYDELEWAMKFEGQGGSIEALDDRRKRVIDIYRLYNRSNRHKMEPIPVAVIPEELR